MSVHILDENIKGLPREEALLSNIRVELLDHSEREGFDHLLATRHYLKNPTAVGQVLRHVIKYEQEWLGLFVFASPAFHLKPREQWLHWNHRHLEARRHLLAQNSRFLILASPSQWPNLASRALKLVCQRLSEDWRREFGHPVLAVETFVDPQRFRATCYKAAGWQLLGPTQGHERSWKDFYTDARHPKELWARPLGEKSLEQLRSPELPPELARHERPLPPACPIPSKKLDSLWRCFERMQDPRKPRGLRHKLAGILTVIALAMIAGCKGPHAVAEFAHDLNHGQRRLLRLRPRPGKPRQYDVPCERTFRRMLEEIDPEALKETLVRWMEGEDDRPVEVIHLDGKVLKNAEPAPAQPKALKAGKKGKKSKTPEVIPVTDPPEISEIPLEMQKPKADKALTLVNFITPNQRLIDQVAVPQNTNEEAAVALHWPKMSLAGICVTSDAAHTIKANCRWLTQECEGDYFFALKKNQPHALEKAEQAFSGDFPPSGHDPG